MIIVTCDLCRKQVHGGYHTVQVGNGKRSGCVW